MLIQQRHSVKSNMIKPCKKKDLDNRPLKEQKWCLYNKVGTKLLGRHSSKESALKQERAIQTHKHGSFIMKKEANGIIVKNKAEKTAAYSAEDLKRVTLELQNMMSTLPDKSRKNVLNYINRALSKASWDSSMKANKPVNINALLPQKAEGSARAQRLTRVIERIEKRSDVIRHKDTFKDNSPSKNKLIKDKIISIVNGQGEVNFNDLAKYVNEAVECSPGAVRESLTELAYDGKVDVETRKDKGYGPGRGQLVVKRISK